MNMEVETTGLERQTQTAENSKIKYVIYYVLPGYTLGGGGGSQVPQSSIIGPLKITIVITVIMCFRLIF